MFYVTMLSCTNNYYVHMNICTNENYPLYGIHHRHCVYKDLHVCKAPGSKVIMLLWKQ